MPQPSQITTPKSSKTFKKNGMFFFKVFGCTPHLPKWSKMLPKSAPGPPKTGQVEAKIGPRPPKLGPRWPSCCHLGPSWAILLPSWPILGATLRILAPALLDFFGNSTLHRAKVQKIVPRAPPDLHFWYFWSLRTTIFITFRVAFSLFSSLLSIFGSCFNFSFTYVLHILP